MKPKPVGHSSSGYDYWAETCERSRAVLESIAGYDEIKLALRDSQTGRILSPPDFLLVNDFLTLVQLNLNENPFYPSFESASEEQSRRSVVMFSVAQAAGRLRLSKQRIRQLFKENRLSGVKYKSCIEFSEYEIAKYETSRGWVAS